MSRHFDDDTTIPHPYREGKTPTELGTLLGYLLPAFLNQSTKFDHENCTCNIQFQQVLCNDNTKLRITL